MIKKSRAGEMTPLDEQDWERYEYLEYLVRMAKAAAQLHGGQTDAENLALCCAE
jgi:hypothetical protein